MNRLLKLSAFLLALVSAAWLSGSPVAAEDPISGRIIDIDDSGFPRVRIVMSLVEEGGRPVTGVRSTSFQAEETGATARVRSVQTVVDEGVGVAVVLTIDASGSMFGAALAAAKSSAAAFVDSLQASDQAAVIRFSNNVDVVSAMGSDRGASLRALQALEPLGDTALYSAVERSVQVAQSAQLTRRAIILLSDGREVGGLSSISREDSLVRAQAAGIPVYVIGLGASIDRDYLEELASVSGGAFFEAPDESSIPDTYRRLTDILRSQYVLTLESTGPEQQKDRSVVLRVSTSQGQTELRADYTSRRDIREATPVPVEDVVAVPQVEEGTNARTLALIFGGLTLAVVVVTSGWFVQTKLRGQKASAELAVLSSQASTELRSAPAPSPTAPAPPSRLSLVVVEGPKAGSSFVLGDAPLSVGSSPECAIQLEGEGIGDVHARTWARDGKVMFHVLPATGQRAPTGATGWLSLEPGEFLQVGPHRLVVEREPASS